MPRLELSTDAERDVEGMFLYGVMQFGSSQADSYTAGLRQTLDRIVQHPAAARLREEIRPPVRLYRYRAHHILYAVDGERIIILRILHRSANWLDHL